MADLSKFNPLIKLVLQGKRQWEWAPILIACVSLGVFFASSGWNKLFQEKTRQGLIKVMTEAGISFPEFMS